MKDRNGAEHSEENGRFVWVGGIEDIPPMARQPDDLGGVRKVVPQGGKNGLTTRVARVKVDLPEKEYAELCSAIRTRYGDKIPRSDTVFYGDSVYKIQYTKSSEKIECVQKIQIDGNEDLIDVMTRRHYDRAKQNGR